MLLGISQQLLTYTLLIPQLYKDVFGRRLLLKLICQGYWSIIWDELEKFSNWFYVWELKEDWPSGSLLRP